MFHLRSHLCRSNVRYAGRYIHTLPQALSTGVLEKKYDAIVVGAGHNGLVAQAAYLQRKGHQVLVLERRHVVGGAAVTEEIIPDFKFSRASYLLSLLRPKIIKDLELKKHGLKFHLRRVSAFTPLKGRKGGSTEPSSLTLGLDMPANQRQIAQFSTKDAEAYSKYEKFIGNVAKSFENIVDCAPPQPLSSLRDLPQIGFRAFESIAMLGKASFSLGKDLPSALTLITAPASKVLNRWFESELLKATLATDAVIGAMLSPHTPGSGYVLLHHCFGGIDDVPGAWAYPEGGMGAVSAAIAASAEACGVTIVTEAPVKRILTDFDNDTHKAAGVVLDNNTLIPSGCVLSNATPEVTFKQLVMEDDLPSEFLANVSTIDYTSPVTKINVALKGLPQFLAAEPHTSEHAPYHQATIHLNSESISMVHSAYLEAAEMGIPSKLPMIEMCLPSVLDKTLAPPGCHVASLFVQYTPYVLSGGQQWSTETRSQFAEKVFQSVEEYAPGFRSLVVGYECLPPTELERIFGLTGGNIFHGAMSLDQLYFLRPVPSHASYESPISGLYLCGSGAHPGGGVTGAPGYNAARCVLSNLKQKRSSKKEDNDWWGKLFK